MPTFQYRALQTNGSIAEGQVEAGGRQEALRQMEGRGLRPLKLTEQLNGKSAKAERPKPAPVVRSEKPPEPIEAPASPPARPMSLGVVFWDRTTFTSRIGAVFSVRCWTASLKMCLSSSSRTGSTGSRPAARLPRRRSCQSWSDSFRFQTSQFHRQPIVPTCSVARAPPPMGCALPIWGLPR